MTEEEVRGTTIRNQTLDTTLDYGTPEQSHPLNVDIPLNMDHKYIVFGGCGAVGYFLLSFEGDQLKVISVDLHDVESSPKFYLLRNEPCRVLISWKLMLVVQRREGECFGKFEVAEEEA